MTEQILSEVAEAQQDIILCVRMLRDQQKIQFSMLEDVVQQITKLQKSLWLLDHEIRKADRDATQEEES